MNKVFHYYLLITVLLFMSCNNSKNNSHIKTQSTPAVPLSGTCWKLIELMEQPIPASSDSNREAHIKFDADVKTVSGNGGCNTFRAEYQAPDPSHLTFGPAISTKMYCDEAKYESLFFDVLSKTANYSINGDTLILTNAASDSSAKLVRTRYIN